MTLEILSDNTPQLNPIELARHVLDELSSRGATDSVLLDVRGLTTIADYFVVSTVSNTRQMRALLDLLDRELPVVAGRHPRIEGESPDLWVLADFGDVVIHILSEEGRMYFRLEEFWAEAPIVLRVQ